MVLASPAQNLLKLALEPQVTTTRGFGIISIYEIKNTTLLFCSVDIVVTIVTQALLF